ncbi:MAG: RNase adapter RapZ [Nitrospira sp.]|nr:RNase adapter RapZ [Nitrospira sp.]
MKRRRAPSTHNTLPDIVIITGLSGSGKTVALRALEDAGFFCVDNLPVTLINSFLARLSRNGEIKRIGIGIDIREKSFLSGVSDVLKNLRKKYRVEIVFLESEEEVLLRRYRETRRPHPLRGKIENVIKIEKERLTPLRDAADRVVDTSPFTPHQLRDYVTSIYGFKKGKGAMTVGIISFGYKFGTPQNIDLLFDVRFLPNPNFVPELKPLRGTEKKVSDYVLKKPDAKAYLKKIKDIIDFLIPLYIKEGRTYLTIGIGCTGGNHRSPAIAEALGRHLKKSSLDLSVVHRDMR